MGFQFRIIVDGERRLSITGCRVLDVTQPCSRSFNPFYTELVFVHNAREGNSLPDNVIAAWPWARDWTHGVIERINYIVSMDEESISINRHTNMPHRDVIHLEDFGLTYPITITDLAYNWASVNAIWRLLSFDERFFIRDFAGYQLVVEVFGLAPP